MAGAGSRKGLLSSLGGLFLGTTRGEMQGVCFFFFFCPVPESMYPLTAFLLSPGQWLQLSLVGCVSRCQALDWFTATYNTLQRHFRVPEAVHALTLL